MLAKIVFWHGKVSDTNYIWFPYLFLKPQPHEEISFLKASLIMAPLWGIYMGLPYGVYFMVTENWPLIKFGVYIGKFSVFFLVWFNVVTRPLWNLRAKGLAIEKSV